MKTYPSRSFRDYVLLVRRFKWRATAFLLGAMLLAVLWVSFAPREYQSEAKLFVRLGRENVALDPTVSPSETIPLSSTREAEMNSIVEHLRSRYLLEKVLGVVQPRYANASPEAKEKALDRLEEQVHVTSPRSSMVLTVEGRGESPQQAQKTVATLVEVYLDEHMRINRATGSYEFFVEQANLLKGQLESARAARRDAKSKAGMASIEGRRTALESQISALETGIHEVSAALTASDARITALRAAVDSLPEALLRQMVGGAPHDGLARMQEQLFELRMREKELLSKRTEAHPVAIAIREQVREVEEALRREQPDREEIMAALSAREVADRASLAVQKEELQAQLDQLSGDLVALNEAEVVIEERARAVRQLEAQYLAYVENLEEARMDQALRADRISNVSILQPATLVLKPVRPRKAFILLLAFLGGAAGAFGVVLLSEQLEPTSGIDEHAAPDLDSRRRAASPRVPQHASSASGGNGAGVRAGT